MFGLFKKVKQENIVEEEDKILLCAKRIIENGDIKEDNISCRNIPSVTLQDDKGNTLYVSWYNTSKSSVCDVRINSRPVPIDYDKEIFNLIQGRVQVLRKEYLEMVIDSMAD